MANGKKIDLGIIFFCVIGAVEWWFLSTAPSALAFLVASLLLAYLFLFFCLLAVLLPESGAQRKAESFVPLPQAETYKPKASMLQLIDSLPLGSST